MNPLFHELFQNTRFIYKELNNALKEHELFAAQWTIIYCIQLKGEITMKQICNYINVEAPTVTRTVSRLVELGWLTTIEGIDRRERIVQLSEEALTKLSRIKETIIQFENRFLEVLTEEEQLVLMGLLKKMNKEGQ